MNRLSDSRVGTAFSTSALVARRRARHDLAQLITTAALVAATTFLAVAAPGYVLSTLDEGAKDAVRRAGASADLLARVTIGEPAPGAQTVTALGSIGVAADMPSLLTPALQSVFDGSSFSAISGDVRVRQVDGEPWDGEGTLYSQIAMLTPENRESFALTDGRLPEDRKPGSREPIEVVVSQDAASAGGFELGALLNLGMPPKPQSTDAVVLDSNGEPPPPPPVAVLEVVGIAAASDVTDDIWEDTPEIWTPRIREAAPPFQREARFTALTDPVGMSAATEFLDYPVVGTTRLRIDAERFSYELATTVVNETRAFMSDGQPLAGDTVALVSVQSELPRVLGDYPSQARAALAQMSLMMSGVLGIAAVTLILLSRLLVGQRGPALALERARGASVASVGIRALLESVLVTAVGTVVGVGLSVLLVPGGLRDLLPLVVVIVVAILAGPIQAMAQARSLWTGKRDPANRRDRQLLSRKRKTQRVVIEAVVIALAAASLISIRGRGLLQNRTDGVDPLLVAAPLLMAVAVTLIVIRVYPYPVRAIGLLAQRTRGVLGLLGSVRARAAVAALPLLALALGSALSVTGAMLVDTVRDGQVGAAWERVGADARVDSELDPADEAQLREATGVETVSGIRSRRGVALDLGTTTKTVTIVGIDRNYPDIIDELPDQPSAELLRQLAPSADEPDVLPIVVDQATADQLLREDIAMYFGPAYIDLRVIGTSELAPNGYLEGPFAYVDLEALASQLPDSLVPNRFLVMGDGARAAVEALPVDPLDALSWSGWIEERRGLALVAGVERVMVFSVVAVALLSIVALVATVIGGARARGRALSMLRTLGMPPRLGWWLALAELGPLIVAAILGGITAGLIVVLTLTPSIGLSILAGGTTIPATSVSPIVFIALAGAGLLLLVLGALADVLVHRRDKLSEVLRVGETV